MRLHALLFSALLAVVATSANPAAGGDNEPAAAAMETAASALWDQADAESDPEKKRATFARAAKTYEEANRLSPRFERIRSAASAWKNAGDDLRAVDDLEDALRQAPPAGDREEISRLLSVLDKGLGRVEVFGPPGALVLVRDRELQMPATFRESPGSRTVRVRLSDGSVVERIVSLVAAQTVRLDLQPSAAPTPDFVRAPSERKVEPSKPGELSSLVIAGISLSSLGAAGGIATGVVTALGYQADEDADTQRVGSEDMQRAVDYQRAAWGLGVPSVTIGAVGVILLLVDVASPASPKPPQLSLCAGPGAWGGSLCGRFP